MITSRTLDLFLRVEVETVDIYDCGSKALPYLLGKLANTRIELETEDYIKIFANVPKVQNLNLRNAGQFKDAVVDYIIERRVPLRSLQLEAANLVSNEKWIVLFEECGERLESLQLSWLDYSMDDEAFMILARFCPNLTRLKLKKCFRLGEAALSAMTELKQLQPLSLQFPTVTSPSCLIELITAIGPNLQSLSLESFSDADDDVLYAVHHACTRLSKLRFTENDVSTDAGFLNLFTHWSNPPLAMIDFSSNRSMDYAKPDGPDRAIGLASAGFEALMEHSGSRLERLDISSCRHISYETFSKLFNSKNQYPFLKDINISFLTKVDNAIVVGILKSCPSLIKVTAFGCFNVVGVPVPKGVALIGVPNAQDAIIQEGVVAADLF